MERTKAEHSQRLPVYTAEAEGVRRTTELLTPYQGPLPQEGEEMHVQRIEIM